MNYRHAFHAGNHADVLKHAFMLLCLEYMARKPGPISFLDTHAGRGLYDLTGEEAQRSPEWRAGAARVFDWPERPPALAPFQRALRDLNGDHLHHYPGSPWLAANALRSQDSLSLCELHPQECMALRRVILWDGQSLQRRADVHERDGFEALRGLLPLPHKRALILIDPSYEHELDVLRTVSALRAARVRMRQAVFIWWRPLKQAALIDAADGELSTDDRFSALRLDLIVRGQPSLGLGGSSLLIVNAPFAVHETARNVLAPLSARLAQDGQATWRVTKLGQS